MTGQLPFTRHLRPFHCAVTSFLLVFSCVALGWADYQKGLQAYTVGDYATALKEWRALAEQGDASAQNNLGVMYENGQGLPKNYEQAHVWYQQAAEQGLPSAQANIGVLYENG